MRSTTAPNELAFLSRHFEGEEKKRIKALAGILEAATRRKGDGTEIGGTPFTFLKLANNPVGRLVDAGKIGAVELRAADDISIAVYTITGALQIRPASLDRIDCGTSALLGAESQAVAAAQRRYRTFADFWSPRIKRGDPTFTIVIRAVVDECPFAVIERDLGIRHGTARKVVVRGLRHYAALARWVDAAAAGQWMTEAESGFRLRPCDAPDQRQNAMGARIGRRQTDTTHRVRR